MILLLTTSGEARAHPSARASMSDWIVSPGVGVGPITLGMPWSTAGALVGSRYHCRAEPRGNGMIYDSGRAGLMVFVDRNGRIQMIVVLSNRYKTAEGCHVGSPLAMAAHVYGMPRAGYSEVPISFPLYRWWWSGLAVQIDPAEKITAIYIKKGSY